MKRFFLLKQIVILVLFFISSVNLAQFIDKDLAPTDYLIPYPVSLEIDSTAKCNFSSDVDLKFNKLSSPKLITYAEKIKKRIKDIFLNSKADDENESKTIIEINCVEVPEVNLNNNESYSIEVLKDKIVIEAVTDIGAMRGLETLAQLTQIYAGKSFIPYLKIKDNPRFKWRGLMIDVCRHYIPKSVILRNLDAMAAMKMNVFHWHLSEDQGFRVECKTFPKLHEMGSDGKYFTHEDVKEIIKYANDRGIRVVPEFDIPGHSTAWFVGYPEYASLPGKYEIERHYGVFDPTFDPTKEETYVFFDKFFKEMSELFNDEYIHIGGDENSGKQWDSSKAIQKFKKDNNLKSNHELQAYFNKRIQKILEKYGKKMIGWDEILSTELPKSIVIHSWQGKQGMVTAAKNGYYSILSNGYYIDLCQSIVDHYYNEPLPNDINLTDEEKKYILGGEATMWAELVDSNNIDSRIWPRTAAIAEVLWSGRKSYGQDSIKNIENLYYRFNAYIPNYLAFVGINIMTNRFQRILYMGLDSNTYKVFALIDIVEPLKYYNRHKYTKYSQSTPLNRLVDIAVPNAPFSFYINNLIGRKLRDEKVNLPGSESINMTLSDEEITSYKNNTYLNELIPLFSNVDLSMKIFVELLKIEKGETISDEKYNNLKSSLLELKKPVAELEIPYIDNLLKLLDYLKQNSK